ncbi:MAG: hypothetical protein ACQKBT_08675 [Puniceicoccales bacterium]
MKRILTCGGILLLASFSFGQMGPIESLVENSPFLPPGYRSPVKTRPPEPTAPVSAAASRYELIGVVAKDGEVTISLRRRGEPRGTWLSPGESLDSIKFIQFHMGNREAIVENGGRRETIPLKAPTVTGKVPPIAPATQSAPSMPPPPATAAPKKAENTMKIPVRRRVIVSPQ